MSAHARRRSAALGGARMHSSGVRERGLKLDARTAAFDSLQTDAQRFGCFDFLLGYCLLLCNRVFIRHSAVHSMCSLVYSLVAYLPHHQLHNKLVSYAYR